MSNMIALMSVFNEEDLLEESVRSIAPYVDEVRIFDGPFLEYPKHGRINERGLEYSTDRSPEIAKRLSEEYLNVNYQITGRLSEQAKRTLMFDSLNEEDIGFVLDGDEIIYGAIGYGMFRLYRHRPEVAYVRVLDLRASKDWRPRVFLKSGKLEYDNWVRIRRDGKVIVDLKTEISFQPRITEFGIVNLRMLYRSKEREDEGTICKEALLKKVK